MRTRFTWALVLFGALAVIAVAVPVALGAPKQNSTPGDLAIGKKVYVQFCGKCHALAAAGAKGTLGPNLDQDKVTFNRVVTAVEEGVGGIQAEYVLRHVSFDQVYDVAKYVTAVRHKGGTGGEFD
jgi:mono/diheme cytochrome c family protein